MSVAQRLVALNAAFLQEIKEDNRELRRLMADAEKMFQDPEQVFATPRQIVDTLGALRDQLAMHFSLEEAYGYFDDAVNVAPRLSERASKLRDEHGGLFSEVCRLVELAERLLYGEHVDARPGSIAAKFLLFRQRFLEHENRENELILESLDDDLGVGD